ncbi:hypothetical protein JW710_02180 [Candidatus Dojkabacteria bacterium]|nr:hypothetical protein [Candidatus Dojkabacteria bacterium]
MSFATEYPNNKQKNSTGSPPPSSQNTSNAPAAPGSGATQSDITSQQTQKQSQQTSIPTPTTNQPTTATQPAVPPQGTNPVQPNVQLTSSPQNTTSGTSKAAADTSMRSQTSNQVPTAAEPTKTLSKQPTQQQVTPEKVTPKPEENSLPPLSKQPTPSKSAAISQQAVSSKQPTPTNGRLKIPVWLIIVLSIILLGAIGTAVYFFVLKDSDFLKDLGLSSDAKTCTYEGNTYNDGQAFTASDGCTKCTCTNGTTECSDEECTSKENLPEVPEGYSDLSEEAITYGAGDSDNREIYLMRNVSDTPRKIGDGMYPAMSPDQKAVAYTEQTSGNTEDADTIYFYSIGDRSTLEMTQDGGNIQQVTWSPDGNYFVVISGTSSVATNTVYSYPEQEKIYEFDSVAGKAMFWINEDRIIFNEPQEVTPDRPWESGMGTGVSSAEIVAQTQKTNQLLTAEALVEYELIDVTADGNILYSKTIASSQNQWSQDDLQATYWEMSTSGEDNTQVGHPDITVEEKILGLTDKSINDYQVLSYQMNPDHTNWYAYVLVESDGDSTTDGEIFVIDTTAETDTSLKIGDGYSVSW